MKKMYIVLLFAIFGLSNSSKMLAQATSSQNVVSEGYYRQVYYTVDTIRNNPKCNRLMICAGGMAMHQEPI